jgi:hypothetical protein
MTASPAFEAPRPSLAGSRNAPESFAFVTLKDRLPVILTRTIDSLTRFLHGQSPPTILHGCQQRSIGDSQNCNDCDGSIDICSTDCNNSNGCNDCEGSIDIRSTDCNNSKGYNDCEGSTECDNPKGYNDCDGSTDGDVWENVIEQGKKVVGQLSQMRYELQCNKPLRPLETVLFTAEELEQWNSQLERWSKSGNESD